MWLIIPEKQKEHILNKLLEKIPNIDIETRRKLALQKLEEAQREYDMLC